MATRARTRACPAVQAHRSLLSLDDKALLQVLLAAQQKGVLVQLASLGRHVCRVARSRVPVVLSIKDQRQAGLVIRSHAAGRAPFSGCRALRLSVHDPEMSPSAGEVLCIAEQWTALQQLDLEVGPRWRMPHPRSWELQEQEALALVPCVPSLVSCVPALQQLRHLVLKVPALGAGSVQHIVQLTQLTSLCITAREAAADAAAAADMSAMAGMTNLVELDLKWELAPHLPAGPEGPYCFPSSLVTLKVSSSGHESPAPMAGWVAHLPGALQLQHLELIYGSDQEQHHSTHPRAVLGFLGKHRPTQMRTLSFSGYTADWTASVEGLPDAVGSVGSEYRPSASLAALKGLQSLSSSYLLSVRSKEDWQHLTQLTALTWLSGASFYWAPPLGSGARLAWTAAGLEVCSFHLGGYGLGCLLLACPELQEVSLRVSGSEGGFTQPAGPPLPPHPNLHSVKLSECSSWGDTAAAVKQMAALAPVLRGVSRLTFEWPEPSSEGMPALPDLSPCTALTSLVFIYRPSWGSTGDPREADFLSMVAPLVQLQQLEVEGAEWLNAGIASRLQRRLPRLKELDMAYCGRLAVENERDYHPDYRSHGLLAELEEEAVLKVASMLPPGLQLNVEDDL